MSRAKIRAEYDQAVTLLRGTYGLYVRRTGDTGNKGQGSLIPGKADYFSVCKRRDPTVTESTA